MEDLLWALCRGSVTFKWNGMLSNSIWKSHSLCATICVNLEEGVEISCQILSQWAWSSLSTTNFIGFNQNATHLLPDHRWIACSAVTRGSCVFNACDHRILHDVSVSKRNLRSWRTARDDFGFLDWQIYFHKECNYMNIKCQWNDVIIFFDKWILPKYTAKIT